MKRYLVLDNIAYGTGVIKTAKPGDVVELDDKDAAALLKRGAVKEAS
jgi:hypothetical protein